MARSWIVLSKPCTSLCQFDVAETTAQDAACELEKRVAHLERENASLHDENDAQEQYSRRNCLLLHGVTSVVNVVNTFGHRSSTLSDIGRQRRQHFRTPVVNTFGHRSSTSSILSDTVRQRFRTSVVNAFGHRSLTLSDIGRQRRQHFRTSVVNVVNTFGHRSSTLSDASRHVASIGCFSGRMLACHADRPRDYAIVV